MRIVVHLLPVAMAVAGVQADTIDPQRAAADLETARQRLVADLIDRELPIESSAYRKQLEQLNRHVHEVLADGSAYWDRYHDVHQPAISYNGVAWHDLFLLARAYHMPGGDGHENEKIRAAVEEGLDHLSQFAYPDCPRPRNWWAWQIGMPMHLIPTLLLMEERIDPDLFQRQVETARYLVFSRKLKEPTDGVYRGKTDMNQLWFARLRLYLGLLQRDPTMVERWAVRSFAELAPAGKGYWQADGSYKFHGAIPMWAYGEAFLQDYGRLLMLFSNTVYQPAAEYRRCFERMTLDYVNGFLYRGRMGPAMIGRTITRGDDHCFTRYGITGLAALAAIEKSTDRSERNYLPLIAREYRWFAADQRTAARADVLTAGLPQVEPAAPVDDLFAYPDSDYLQITRPDWAIGIKMHSSRNGGYESINGENLQGWFLSHGTMFHMFSGNEWDGCWPTLDWTRLPGATAAVEVKKGNTSDFVGVMRLSDRQAMAAMELTRDDFNARKSWVVDGQHIICQGSGIRGPGRVETVLFNQPVETGAELLIDGEPAPAEAFDRRVTIQSLWLEKMGYQFPTPQVVRLIRETRSSDWTSVRNPAIHGAGGVRDQEYLIGLIEHGPQQDHYQYVLRPDVDRSGLTQLSEILRQYRLTVDGPHRVQAAERDWQAVVFWEQGSVDALAVDQGCLVFQNGKQLKLVEPTWKLEQIGVAIKGERSVLAVERGRPVQLK